MSSFGNKQLNKAVLSTRTSFAALTTELAMQTRQPQLSSSLETARFRNLACAQTMLISKLFILLVQKRVGKFRVSEKLEIKAK